MRKWEKVELGKIASDFQNGIGKNKEYYGTGSKVANIGDLYEKPVFKPVKYSLLDVSENEIEKYKLQRGDILFVRSSVKKEGIAYCSMYDSDETCLFSSFMIRCRPKKSIINSKFLAYQLRSPKYRNILINASNTATITNISQPILKNIEVDVPPLPIQQQIAELLDTADALRRHTADQLAALDELAQGVFLEMFGDVESNEKSWKKIKLSKISEISSGSTPSRKQEKYWGGDIPWVKTGEVNGGEILDTEEKITSEGFNNSSLKKYPKGSILIAMYGQGKTRGKVAYLGIEATTNQACAVLELSGKINPDYLFYFLKKSYETLRNLGRGGNQPNLNGRIIKDFEILSPPLHLQAHFATIIQNIVAQKESLRASLQASEALFAGLLQEVFGNG